MARRRSAGEGTIGRRSDGRWQARLDLGYQNGHRIRKSFYGSSMREVADQLTKARHDLQRGLPVRFDGRQTLEAFLRQWLADVVKASVRPSTFTAYELHVRRHIVPELGRVPLAKLTPQQVQTLLNRQARELSPRSVHHVRAVLRRALNQAMRWDLIPRNVATLVDPPRVPAKEASFLTPEQATEFLIAARSDRLYALFALATATGLRQGEALGLGWEDVDLEAGAVRVRRALQRVAGRAQFVEPKSARGRRAVPLSPLLVEQLRAHRRYQIEERLWAGSRWREHGLVFTTTIGTPLDATNVTHRLHALQRRSGLPRFRFHDLRHTAATRMLLDGIPARVVMEILGHSQISLTLNTYSHVIPSLTEQATEGMDALLATVPALQLDRAATASRKLDGWSAGLANGREPGPVSAPNVTKVVE